MGRLPAIITSSSLLILLIAIAAICVLPPSLRYESSRSRPNQTRTKHLEGLYSGYPIGITVSKINHENVRKILGANEVLSVACSEGALTHELYIAYWCEGNEFSYEAVRHPPDNCLPGSGWTCIESRSNERIWVGDSESSPVEWRRFTKPGIPSTELIYLCLNGKRPMAWISPPRRSTEKLGQKGAIAESAFLGFWKGQVGLPDLTTREFFYMNSVRSTEKTYFIRLSTSGSLKEVIRSRALRHQLEELSHIGVALVESQTLDVGLHDR